MVDDLLATSVREEQPFEDLKREDDRHVERLRVELERLVKEGKFR